MAAAAAREQKARRFLRTGGAEQRTKRKNAIKDEPCVFIDRNTVFCVQLAQRDLERPLLGAELAEAIHRKIDALADAHSRKADQEQDIRFENVDASQLRFQTLVVF